MARSYHFRRWCLPRALEVDLEAAFELPPAGRFHRLITRRTSSALTDLGYTPVPRPALAAELVRRGWPPKAAHRWLEGGDHWARHNDVDDRRLYQRRYRSRTKQLIRTGRFDDVERFSKTSGWLTW